MTTSLHDLIKVHIHQMVSGMNPQVRGNIYPLVMQEVEKYIIQVVLDETRDNFRVTARLLGISRSKLYRKVEQLGIVTKKNKSIVVD